MGLIAKIDKAMIRRREAKAIKALEKEVVGANIFPWVDQWPFDNPDELVGRKGATVYREMVEEDSEIKGTMKEIVYSVMSVPHLIQPADKDDEKAIEQADFVRDSLDSLGGRNPKGYTFQTKQVLLNELIFDPLITGYGVWEKNWTRDDRGRIVLDHLKGKPVDDYEFMTDSFGNLQEIRFLVHGRYQYLNPDKFVIFPWLPFYMNWYGSSELRSLYAYYSLNKLIIRMAGHYGIKIGGGFFIGKYPRGNMTAKTLLLDALRSASASGVLVIPADVEVAIHKASSSEGDFFAKMLDWSTKKIRRGLIGLTTTAEPSRSGDAAGQESRDSSVKLPMIEFISAMVCQVVQSQIVKPMIDYNWLPSERRYPKFTFGPRKKQDAEANMKVAVQAWNIGARIPESYIEEKCGIPAPKEGEPFLWIGQVAELKGAGGRGEATPAQLPDGIGTEVATQFAESRDSKANARKLMKGLDRIEAEYKGLVREYVKQAGEKYLAALDRNIEKWRKHRNEVNGLHLPYQGKIEALVKQYAGEARKYGQATAKQEIETARQQAARRLGIKLAEPEDTAARGMRAMDVPDDYASAVGNHWGRTFTGKMASEFTSAFLAGLDAGDSIQDIRRRFEKTWKKYGGEGKPPDWWELNRMIRNTESQVFNKARFRMGSETDIVVGYRYIAELDDRTTQLCRSLDGSVWPKADPRVAIYYPPNHHQCRSMMDYVFAWEAPPEWSPFPTAKDMQPDPYFGGEMER